MKEFNLEEAKAGKSVCTRAGKPVRILCFDAKSPYPIKALVDTTGNHETIVEYTIDGLYYGKETSDSFDLMMAPVKHTGWINLYNFNNKVRTGFNVYDNEQEAIDKHNTSYSEYKTIKIEWEE